MEASVDKGTGLDVPRCTAEKPECSVARIGRPSVGPREHKHDLEKGLVVYGNTVLREDGEKKGLPKRGANAETEGRAYTGLRRRGSRGALRKECPSIRPETSQTEG